ncbi:MULTISPECIES: DNA topoisomerase IB [unclassified Leeuwenhoekiella]|uniref:DNA topoisomerase IB n=1 Tax=unclassified Leeuwenhoekiella TaxID=2615029 RepID=UPI000C44E22C|nr:MULTISPECIES: DNA topoisomerase IB [unclassified Leeuwenhoekiella]MAW95075.1 DNA topoisomerase I [Leeuwenhoekiella sp.]MBA79795.1 DNA topoisomerase I [Leeuwenhoekiella sp.]|tara:strand:+ start:56548 stop:57624 length:1077 start_codon:yes stop_codon:yes gene_type:complete
MTITQDTLHDILDSPQEAAKLANLIYVTDEHLTICRKKHGKGFRYCKNDITIKSKPLLQRIKKLVIPPAWQDVLISEPENGHLQAVGRDEKDRKVYLYHENWNKLRNETKFLKLAAFANVLPQLRKKVDQDLDAPEMTRRKVLALVIRLLEETHIRVGNAYYAKHNETYGLSTLRTRHVKTTESGIRFKFVGKKGKEHDIALTDEKLIDLVNQCEDIPGWELFQFYDENGNKDHIDSGMVNEYIHELSGDLFSAKDFRTWAATKIFFESLRDLGYVEDEKQNAKNLITAYDATAEGLGNTRSVCRDYYVHPVIPEAYQDGIITQSFDKLKDKSLRNRKNFSKTEQVIADMLNTYEVSI